MPRTRDRLLDLFLDGAGGPEAEAAPVRPPFGFLLPVAAGSQLAGTVSGRLSNVIFNDGSVFEAQGVSDPLRGQFNLDRLMNPPRCGALISEVQKLER